MASDDFDQWNPTTSGGQHFKSAIEGLAERYGGGESGPAEPGQAQESAASNTPQPSTPALPEGWTTVTKFRQSTGAPYYAYKSPEGKRYRSLVEVYAATGQVTRKRRAVNKRQPRATNKKLRVTSSKHTASGDNELRAYVPSIYIGLFDDETTPGAKEFMEQRMYRFTEARALVVNALKKEFADYQAKEARDRAIRKEIEDLKAKQKAAAEALLEAEQALKAKEAEYIEYGII